MASILREVSKTVFGSGTAPPKRVIFVGTRGSSKTTTLGLIALTCDILSTQEPGFTHFIDERTSGICQVPSDLCQGMFPEPTPPSLIYEADLFLSWKTTLTEKTLMLPFCETAGEDIQNLIGPYQKSVYKQSVDYQQADNLNRYICDSNGYVLVVPVSRAHIEGVPQMDEEPQALLQDPDVNLHRILSAIYRYKMKSRSPKIEGIAVVLTKYDMVDAYLKNKGMDLYNPQGAKAFLDTYFRQTMGSLKHYGIEKVKKGFGTLRVVEIHAFVFQVGVNHVVFCEDNGDAFNLWASTFHFVAVDGTEDPVQIYVGVLKQGLRFLIHLGNTFNMRSADGHN